MKVTESSRPKLEPFWVTCKTTFMILVTPCLWTSELRGHVRLVAIYQRMRVEFISFDTTHCTLTASVSKRFLPQVKSWTTSPHCVKTTRVTISSISSSELKELSASSLKQPFSAHLFPNPNNWPSSLAIHLKTSSRF